MSVVDVLLQFLEDRLELVRPFPFREQFFLDISLFLDTGQCFLMALERTDAQVGVDFAQPNAVLREKLAPVLTVLIEYSRRYERHSITNLI